MHVLANLGAQVMNRFAAGRTNRKPRRDTLDLKPFVVKIISTHRRHQTAHTKRIQCVVHCLGVTKTVHLDVPHNFTV